MKRVELRCPHCGAEWVEYLGPFACAVYSKCSNCHKPIRTNHWPAYGKAEVFRDTSDQEGGR